MPKIILTTLNIRHSHSALGLRYLLANMGELQSDTTIREFTLEPWPIDIAEKLLLERPAIIGIGVYIWNLENSTRLVKLLKILSPETPVVLGGPEVSHEWQGAQIVELADYLVTGQADLAFAQLCRQILSGNPPGAKVIPADPPELSQLNAPYPFYTDRDIQERQVYVEASRGCPFKCEFCLSALDKSATPFPLAPFLNQLDQLHKRGARHFKFVDRTFNLNPKLSGAILDFFLERIDDSLFLHFEVIPDRLPEVLKRRLKRFPTGTLQLEIGIQSFNPQVQALISRKQDNFKSVENLRWLRQETHAHLHTDLVIGLPGEDLASFAAGFDKLVRLAPQEIQVGILKRLKGTPISRHDSSSAMRYNPDPPFNILSNDLIGFREMQRLTRFARYWEMIVNSGRFRASLPAILGEQPFDRFMSLSDWLYLRTGQVHRINLKRLFDLLYEGLTGHLGMEPGSVADLLERDYLESGSKGAPVFLNHRGGDLAARRAFATRHSRRQRRHH